MKTRSSCAPRGARGGRIIGVENGVLPAHGNSRRRVDQSRSRGARINRRFGDLDLILIESGGDNLAGRSAGVIRLDHYVIDVAAGDKIPRKGGPGITRSDLLIINKIDLAPHVGADLAVMERDAKKMRGARPFVFTNLKTGTGLSAILDWLRDDLQQAASA